MIRLGNIICRKTIAAGRHYAMTRRNKLWLKLYNALNNTNYTDPDALELNTLENVIFIKMHNDMSFLVDSQMTLYEHQRTVNPNMPLRGFIYFSKLYQKYLSKTEELLTNSTPIKIPNPNYIVFTMVTQSVMKIMSLNCLTLLCLKIKAVSSNGRHEF